MRAKFWSLAAFCIAQYFCVGFESVAQVGYFSFVGYATVRQALPSDSVQQYEQLLRTDDAPFQRFALPFQFNFLGMNVHELFISPNGALHYSYVQPCPSFNAFATTACDFRNSYYNVIGGLLADLNPSTSPGGDISSYSGADSVTIQYSNIVYYNTTLKNDFRISLFTDSHIEISYDRITKTNAFPQNKYWSSGLRGARTSMYAYFDKQQKIFWNEQWGMNVSGIYPNQADVITGNQFNICPVSRQWCATPSVLSRTVLENEADALVLTSELLSCTALVELGVVIADSVAPNDLRWQLLCMTFNNVSISCNISEILALDATDNVLVTPAWRLPGETNFTAMPVEGISIQVVDSIHNASSGSDLDVGCANNVDSAACGASSCAICASNYTCFDLPCADSVHNLPVVSDTAAASDVFTRPTCDNNACPIVNASSASTYYTDYDNQCCMLSAMDCSGQCGGAAVVAVNTDGAVVCCPNYAAVDCAGVCDGKAQRDACGTCQGTDIHAIGCFNSADIVITTPSHDGILYPVYNVITPGGLRSKLYINVTNNSPFRILVFFAEEMATKLNAPELFLPGGEMPVEVNNTVSFPIVSSIELLYIGNMTTWVTKNVNVRFKRFVYMDMVYDNLIPVHPATVNCSNITSRETCMRLPACIFCFTNPNMRILRAQDVVYGNAQERRLFIEVVPGAVSDTGDNLQGVCGDGWFSEDCALIAPDAFASNGAARGALRAHDVTVALVMAIFILQIVLTMLKRN